MSILSDYHLPITHMRQLLNEKKLVLSLGAGVSKSFGIPNWPELVEKIAINEEVQCGDSIKESTSLPLTTKVQILFEQFKINWKRCHPNTIDFEDELIHEAWIKLIHKELYRNNLFEKKTHDYLDEFIPIIKKSPITINYNFDNVIEKSIEKEKKENEVKEYETVWRPSLQFKRPDCVIYHPNGYLPMSLSEGHSEHFVFSEETFQDQLLDSIVGYYSPLLYMFFNYTLLFIGLSIEDQNLRHMLRQNAIINPGHIHYYVYFLKPTETLNKEDMESIRSSYFETFNLYTLFLDSKGIKELGWYINMPKSEFQLESENEQKPLAYNFYISGAPGTGKTSVLDLLTSYNVFNEWPSKSHPNLFKEDNKLTPEERIELDEWISRQFRLKNIKVSETANSSCIQIIDRSPLDPITFADGKGKNAINDAVKKRAESLNKTYKPNYRSKPLQNGHIILFEANPDEIYRRLNKRNPTSYGKEYVQKTLERFNMLFDREAITTIETSNQDISSVAKQVVRTIYFESYQEYDLNKLLEKYMRGEKSIVSDE